MRLVSEINEGRLQGEVSVGLHGDNQVTGELTGETIPDGCVHHERAALETINGTQQR